MNKNSYKLNFSEIIAELSFYDQGPDRKDRYFCSCGGFLKQDEGDLSDIVNINEAPSTADVIGTDEELSEILTTFKVATNSLRCPKCSNKFQAAALNKKLINTDTFFVSGFYHEDSLEKLTLYYSKIKPIAINSEKDDRDKEISFIENLSYIEFDKEKRKLFYKSMDDNESREFDLDEIITIVDSFFTPATEVIISLIDLHYFLNKLAKYVADISNINIVQELLSKIRNKHNEAGLDTFKKIISIFFGIIKYSNLSTVALTKGSTFLYDLMKECQIPKPDILREKNVTAPLDIFNFLTSNYIKLLNEEVNEDNKKLHEFVFRGKKMRENKEGEPEISNEEGEIKIKFSTNDNYKSGKVVKTDSGKLKVVSALSERKISKFLFKKIRNFSDYKQLVKYLKFVEYHELIDLMNKNDLDLLINSIDLLYFRDNISFEETKRLLPIFEDYVKIKTTEINFGIPTKEVDFTFLKDFSFVEYDDSLMMLKSLRFDPKKEFFKIKTYGALLAFHNDILHYYNAMSDAEKTGEFKEFVSKFRFLENKEDYDGPLTVKILSSPGAVMKDASEMKHSGASYISNIMNGQYLMCQVFDRTPNLTKGEIDRFTLGLNFDNKYGLVFDQVKGACNRQGSDRFKKEMMKFLEIKEISYKPLRDLKLRNE